ncbi:MAG: hypothetical protein HC932_01585 [Thermales bacterium]|nr:hypothetical protein [Thermales bacterium]
MFLNTLNGNLVKLQKIETGDLEKIFVVENQLPSEQFNLNNLESREIAYWSIYSKENNTVIGVIGVTSKLDPNYILFRLVNQSRYSDKIFSEVFELLVDYLKYRKLTGKYIVNLRDTTFGKKNVLKQIGFVHNDSDDHWLLEL